MKGERFAGLSGKERKYLPPLLVLVIVVIILVSVYLFFMYRGAKEEEQEFWQRVEQDENNCTLSSVLACKYKTGCEYFHAPCLVPEGWYIQR